MAGTFFAPTFIPSLPDESIQAGMYTCLVVCTVGSIASTAFRYAVRWKYNMKMQKDDLAILLATLINLVANVFQAIAIAHGFGRHTQYLTVEDCIMANKYAMIIVPVSSAANVASKLSIGFLILTCIRGTHRRLSNAMSATMMIMPFLCVLLIILWATQTAPMPLKKIWDPTAPGPFPDTQRFLGILYAFGAFGILTDLLYSLSPLYFLHNVKVPKGNKVLIQVLVGSGLLVTVVAIVSLTYAKTFLALIDMTWILCPRYICDMLERNLAVVIANTPMLKIMMCQRRASQCGSGKASYETKNSSSRNRSGSIALSTTQTLDVEGGPGTWFAKESVGEPATMEVEVVGGVTRPEAARSLDLPVEGHTSRGGLKIMKSVDITIEGSDAPSGAFEKPLFKGNPFTGLPELQPESECKALPEVPEEHESVAMERNDSSASLHSATRPKGPSRKHSAASVASNGTGRYSLFPSAQTTPLPDAWVPRTN